MTDYHPVTKEELGQIRYDCDDVDRHCEDCRFETSEEHLCNFDTVGLIDEILSRPDPLELLQKWTQYEFQKIVGCEGYEEVIDFLKNLVYDQQEIINQLRTNPSAVREQGIREGWL